MIKRLFLILVFVIISIVSQSETLPEVPIPENSLLNDIISPPYESKPIRLTITDKPLFIKPGEIKWLTWKVATGMWYYAPSSTQEVTTGLYRAYLRDLPTKESLRDITRYEKLIERVGYVGEEQSYQLQCPIDPKAYPAMMLLWKVRIGEREEVIGPEPLDVIIWERDENGKIKCIFDTPPWLY
jgi:hypothetical protein